MQSKHLIACVFALLTCLSLLLSAAPPVMGQDGLVPPVHLPIVSGASEPASEANLQDTGTSELPPTDTQPAALSADLLSDIKALSAGALHTCALTTAGGVVCWGYNHSGQLGDGTIADNSSTPVEVIGLASGVQAVSAGDGHTCALTTAGGVLCWGDNSSGQLGDGTTTSISTPVAVSGLASGVQAVSAGAYHTCALTTSGGVKCWGYNDSGQLGDGTTADRYTPVAVNGLISGVQAISAGFFHTCALTTAGGVKCWGDNTSGQLGDNTTTDRFTPVAVSGLASGVQAVNAGGNTCALITSGGVLCWGYNGHGELGDGTTTNSSTPVAVSGLNSGVQAVSTGGGQTCGLTSASGLVCWGWNDHGQLGDGTKTDRSTPVAVSGLASGVLAVSAGAYHTCALTTPGGVKCWGANSHGELGDGTTTNWITPVAVSGLASAVHALSGGVVHTCALTTFGGVKCWGSNYRGQLGDGTTNASYTPIVVSGLTSGVQAVSTGEIYTCALTTAGGVLCWGYNNRGQLGDGTTTDRSTPVAVSGLTSGVLAVSASRDHTCALTTDGGVMCWGSNYGGQLGDGTTNASYTPIVVSGLTSGVQAVSAGDGHTCALTTAGGVKCWGQNYAGQLGDGTKTDRSTPVAVSGLASGVQAVSAGGAHTCALTTAGGVVCWGYNNRGQLGDGTTTDSSTPVAVSGLASGAVAVDVGPYSTCALTTAGGVLCWGANSRGELGDGTTTDRSTPVAVSGLASGVQAVSAGDLHTCALTTAGGIMCWGDNYYGQLGVNPGWAPVDVLASLPEPLTYTVSGRVTVGGAGLSGVTVHAWPQSATTNANGDYTISGLTANYYNVSPSKAGYEFTPPMIWIALLSNLSSVDFSAQAVPPSTYTISGRVTLNSAGLAGVIVSAGGKSATTSATGDFTISGLAAGTYAVTPSKSGYTFSPASSSATAPATGVNFAAQPLPYTVIFLPGIMGSQLSNFPKCLGRTPGVAWLKVDSFSDGPMLNPAPIEGLYLNDDGVTARNACDDIAATGLTESALFLKLLGRDFFHGFVEELSASHVVRVFPYDWRLSLELNAGRLHNFILQETGSNEKVILVGHSMGGLLARVYVSLPSRAAMVARVITVGTPYLGSPQLAYTLLTGEVNFFPSLLYLIAPVASQVKTIARNAPGALQLLPSRPYVQKYAYFVAKDVSQFDVSAVHNHFAQLGKNGPLLQSAEAFHDEYDDLGLANELQGEYWILAATNRSTLSRVWERMVVTRGGGSFRTFTSGAYLPGDGTVTVPSATLSVNGGALRGAAHICTFDSPTIEEHGTLLTNADVRHDVTRLIDGLAPEYCNVANDTAAASTGSGMREVRISGHPWVSVSDPDGNSYGMDESGFVTGTLSDVTIYMTDDSIYVTMPSGAPYTVTVKPVPDAVSATVTEVEDPHSIAVSDFAVVEEEALTRQAQARFEDVPVPAGGQLNLAQLGQPLGSVVVGIDANADGTPEQTLPPDAVLTNPVQAQDTVMPTSTITLNGSKDAQGRYTGAVTLALNAVDNPGGAGVLTSRYSLDAGQTWMKYAAPVQVPFAAATTVQASSTDKAGNQEWPPKQSTLNFAPPPVKLFLPAIRR